MKNQILSLILIFVSTGLYSQECSVTCTKNSPNAIFRSENINDVTLTQGFWADRQKINREVSLKVLWDLANDAEKSSAIENFKIAAGQSELKHRGCDWMDAWVHKWIETASYILATNPDYIFEGRKLSDVVDETIDIISKAQQEDGYLATQVINTQKDRWERRQHHEMYVMGHLLTAASIHHRATGKDNYIEVATKVGDYLFELFNENNETLIDFPENPSIVMGAVELFRETGNRKYLELAKMVVEWRGHTWNGVDNRKIWGETEGGHDQNQNWRPIKDEDEVVGHSVFWSYLYAGATDVYLETGDMELLEALDRLWKDVTTKKMFINGGVSAESKALATRKYGDGQRRIIEGEPIHEGIAAPYRLPNSTSYNETCGQVGNMYWNWRLLLAHGEAKYADIMELNLYNSIISGVELDGEGWSYTNPIRWYGEEHELLRNDSHKRMYPGYKHICCPTNIMRTTASIQGYMYTTNKEGIQLHHYASNKSKILLDEKPFVISQQTDYPWDGHIKITILESHLEREKSISFRIPGWANEPELKINGVVQDVKMSSSGYAQVNKKWNKGDVIEFNIPFEVDMLVAGEKVEYTRNQVAVRRGPIIYCVESNDIPEDMNLFNVKLNKKAKFNIIDGTEVFEGMKLIQTQAIYKEEVGKVDVGLYHKLNDNGHKLIDITLIPYFAWNNREEHQMSIWMPYE